MSSPEFAFEQQKLFSVEPYTSTSAAPIDESEDPLDTVLNFVIQKDTEAAASVLQTAHDESDRTDTKKRLDNVLAINEISGRRGAFAEVIKAIKQQKTDKPKIPDNGELNDPKQIMNRDFYNG